MSGLFDKVLLAGLGLENKVKEKLDSLAKEGSKDVEEGLDMKEDLENKLVENIVDVVGSGLKKVGVAKKEVDSVIVSLAEDLAERLKIVTVDELDVLEKLVMGNREHVSKLEKRMKKLEETIKKLTEERGKA